ncbi:MAG: sigma-70 family RNA polymerase sigma factor [Pontiellaceae bacterium]|nr:sigma-70 family RNA polymerase sigma factor [Pontiellaceae bacterium]MBN2783216.1 sigma-70 family RNA polymerase sigma factor [Pontiellaceae bacterium]
MNDFNQILHSAARGDESSADALLPLVYDELRKLAYARMANQSSDHTLQPTALVHEAWLRMVDDNDRTWQNRSYFFASAATAMRNVLIDHARKKGRKKRGGNRERIDLDQLEISSPEPDDLILAVDDALKQLERVNPKLAKIVVMKYFGGMTNLEVAEAMGIAQSSVGRYWAGARAWLYKQLNEQMDQE